MNATPDPDNGGRRAVEAFFEALRARDGETMASLYRPNGSFTDPAFGKLTGEQAGRMWRSLMRNARDFRVSYTIKEADEGVFAVDWVAKYVFSKTGRPVENHVSSRIWVRDSQIERQIDSFDFHKWAMQAFGRPGRMLGGFGFFQRAIRRKARAGANLPPEE